MLLCTLACKYRFESLFSILLCIYLEVEFLDYVVILCLIQEFSVDNLIPRREAKRKRLFPQKCPQFMKFEVTFTLIACFLSTVVRNLYLDMFYPWIIFSKILLVIIKMQIVVSKKVTLSPTFYYKKFQTWNKVLLSEYSCSHHLDTKMNIFERPVWCWCVIFAHSHKCQGYKNQQKNRKH